MTVWPAFDVERLLERLTTGGVDFVVLGGIAAVLHGSPRVTRDLDICYATDHGNLDALGSVLIELEARLRGVDGDIPFVPDARTLRRVVLLTLATVAGPLDVMTKPSGAPPYEALRANAQRFDLDGFSVLVASIEDLIAMKRAVARPQDLVDAVTLETIRRLSS